MNVQQKNNQRGFTIIEVVLVLAIAGLIFLMVFIALPALQRGQRDTQRRNDVARAQTALNNYQTNSKNAIPADNAWNTTIRDKYLKADGEEFRDPGGSDYSFVATNDTNNSSISFDQQADPVAIYVKSRSTCDGANGVTAAGSRKVTLRIALEGGGVYCVGN